MSPEQLIFGLTFVAVGLGTLAVGLGKRRRLARARGQWHPATATVLRLEFDDSGDSETYHRVYTFETTTGQRIEARPTEGPGNESQPTAGGSVEIFYDPTHPERFLIDDDYTGRFFLVVGALPLIAGGVILAL